MEFRVKKILKELYGAGIIFFYYTKWLIFIGLPILYYLLEYKQNYIMNILWVYSLILIIKDFIVLFLKRRR